MNLETRLTHVASLAAVPVTDVVSIKLRPTEPGAQYTDPFGLSEANAYFYESEYQVLRSHLAGLGFTNTKDGSWRTTRSLKPLLYFEHETGPDFVGTSADVLAIITGLLTIWEFVRVRIAANKTSKSDRYYKDVNELRVEIRRTTNGKEVFHELAYRGSVLLPMPVKSLETAIRKILKTPFKANVTKRKRK
jgi:hypothetical protein